ncbi:MAG TPA: tetraprenyl-beta-curcumene synthase family protein [Clostridia bacterium]|nr:tetraprenyl-beta-curcumene synthase family protein [Clostridia bacterium]
MPKLQKRLKKLKGEASIIWTFCTKVLPAVDKELEGWCNVLLGSTAFPDPLYAIDPASLIRKPRSSGNSTTQPPQSHEITSKDEVGAPLLVEGLRSIEYKRFHAQGGSVFSILQAGKRGAWTVHRPLLRAIVALQTISDYLDNLCDRAGISDEVAFRHLHRAFTDALDERGLDERGTERETSCVPDQNPLASHDDPAHSGPAHNRPAHDDPAGYYAHFPFKHDNGYLNSLVRQCRAILRDLPSYPVVRPNVLRLARLYCDMQAKKHVEAAVRQDLLRSWFYENLPSFPWVDASVGWWEFAAASGSTLGIFALLRAAVRPGLEPCHVDDITRIYFPYITGLHILLDYFIDQMEDEGGGDLNFVKAYQSTEQQNERLLFFIRNSLKGANSLPDGLYHETVIKGMLALYLSDPKVATAGLWPRARVLIRAAGFDTLFMHSLCRILRRYNLG